VPLRRVDSGEYKLFNMVSLCVFFYMLSNHAFQMGGGGRIRVALECGRAHLQIIIRQIPAVAV